MIHNFIPTLKTLLREEILPGEVIFLSYMNIECIDSNYEDGTGGKSIYGTLHFIP